MQAEMMTEFVGENARQFVFRKFTRGVGRDDHEVTACGERIDVVGIKDAQHEAVSVDACRFGDPVPRRRETLEFVLGRSPCAKRRGQDGNLDRPHEESAPEDEPADRVPPPSAVDTRRGNDRAEWITRGDERQEAERCEDDERHEG